MQSARRPWVSCVLLGFVLSLALVLSSCNGFFVGGSSLNSITVSPKSIFLKAGETKQFTASGTTIDGNTKDVTSSAKWTSSSASATVDAAGLVTASSTAGTAIITASQDGVSSTGGVIANASSLSSIAITPLNPSVLSGSNQQLTATATFADNTSRDITSQVAWTSDTTSVATVNTSGVVTGVATGTAKITASVTTTTGTVSGNVTVSVQ